MKGRRATAASLIVAAALAVACEEVLSIDGPVVVGAPGACGLAVSATSCRACLATKCCSQAGTCAGEPACAAHESCMLGCGGNYTCRAHCEIDAPVAFPSAVAALDTCLAQSCNDACGLSCGVNTSYADPGVADVCQACIAANICPQATACTTDLTCEDALHCGLACSTADCQAGCIERFDAGAFVSYAGALANGCLTQCQFGAVWSCVGRVTYPFPKSATATATLTLTDALTGATLPGVVAKSCDRSDQDCASPFGVGTTDAQGKVTLTVAKGPVYGFNGYFDLAPPAAPAPAPPPLHYLWFTDAPLSEPDAQLSSGLFSESELQSLASAVGLTLDPNDAAHGHVVVAASDCLLVPGTGVAISAQGTGPETKLYYYGAASLDPSATVTGWSGLGFFLNVPSGGVTVEATPQKLGRVSSRETLFVRPKAMSLVRATPTP